jgi:peroxiredoxin
MAIRPRLLVLSILGALAISVPAGYAMYRITTPNVDAVLDEPGIYDIPVDGDALDTDTLDGAGRPLPDVELLDATDTAVRSGSLVGTPAVINVWFAACPPCERELPDFAEVHAEYGDRVRFVGVNPFDDVDRMTDFARERGVAYELWRDPNSSFIDAIGVAAFPVTYFVDAEGRIAREAGVLNAEQLRERVEELLG